MSMPILATKLFIPPPRPEVVLRPRLIERLNEGLPAGRKLTLISASAGFGKTTLLSEWVAGCGRPGLSERLFHRQAAGERLGPVPQSLPQRKTVRSRVGKTRHLLRSDAGTISGLVQKAQRFRRHPGAIQSAGKTDSSHLDPVETRLCGRQSKPERVLTRRLLLWLGPLSSRAVRLFLHGWQAHLVQQRDS